MKKNLIWCLPATVLLGCAPPIAPFSVDPSHPASPQAQEAPAPRPSEALPPPLSAGESQDADVPQQHMHMHHGSEQMHMGGMDITGAGMNANKHEMK